MANIKSNTVKKYMELGEVILTALNTTGVQFELDGRDYSSLLLVQGTAADTITLVKGNGFAGVVDFDFTIAANKTYFIPIESAFVKDITGTNRGAVTIKGATTTKVAVVVLP